MGFLLQSTIRYRDRCHLTPISPFYFSTMGSSRLYSLTGGHDVWKQNTWDLNVSIMFLPGWDKRVSDWISDSTFFFPPKLDIARDKEKRLFTAGVREDCMGCANDEFDASRVGELWEVDGEIKAVGLLWLIFFVCNPYMHGQSISSYSI